MSKSREHELTKLEGSDCAGPISVDGVEPLPQSTYQSHRRFPLVDKVLDCTRIQQRYALQICTGRRKGVDVAMTSPKSVPEPLYILLWRENVSLSDDELGINSLNLISHVSL